MKRLLLCVAAGLLLFSTPTRAQTELFFSEYIEGTSNNKALEIYNGTGAAINLSTGGYVIEMYFNGSATAGTTIALTGSVANGDVYVLAQAAANATILAQADQTSSASWYNGDDAVVLRKGGVVIDVIGQIGFDPGTEWGTGLTSTADNTLRRKASILAGDTNGADAFDPAVEWDGFATDTFGGLGSHLTSDAAPFVSSTTPTNGAANVTTNADILINFNEAVNVSGNWFSLSGSISGAHTATVSGGPQNFTLNPDVDFANSETVTVTIFAALVTDQDANDPPDNMTTNSIFSFTTLASVVTSPLRINELNSDTPGTDALEFVELYDGGAGNTSLDGLVVVFYNGSNDLSYAAFDLDGKTTNAAGFFLLGNSGVLPAPGLTFAGNLLQNGADAVAIYFGNASDFPNNTPVTTANLIDAVVYDTDDADDPGLLVLLNSGQPQVNEGTFSSAPDQAIARVPDGGVARNTSTYVQQMPTPGGTNVPREIWQIQGSGLASPFATQYVPAQNNVVTATASNGFTMQTPAARTDNDAQTSDGIFVFTSSAPAVNVGDMVNVYGQVVEFFDFTEYSNSPNVTVVSSGNPLPAPVQLDAFTPSPNQPQAATEFERFEGMRVEITNGVVAGPNQFFASDPIAEVFIVAGPNRPFREPGIEYPGLSGLPVWDGNPEIFEFDPDRLGQPNLAIPAGSTFSATGVLGFEFSDYEFWPTQYSINAVTLPRPVRARNAGEATVATLNLHLLYDTINDPGGDDVATPLEYATKLNKLSLYIRTLLGAPDILAVQEAEKLAVLQDLANKINTDDASLTYTPYLLEGNDVGGIDVGFLVRNTVTVNSVTQFGKTDIFTFDGSLLHDRPPLLLDANLPNGTAISVLCVHQRSLNDIDDPVSGNRVRLKRHTQADSVARIVQRLQNSKPFINLVVTGDFNAFQFTDGYVDVLGQIMGTPSDASQALIPGTDQVNPDLINKVLALPAAEQYSFNFGGSAQVLDHALVSQTLNPAITGVAYARGNSDAAENLESDGTTPLRASDHDGLVLYLTPVPVNADAGADQEICFGQSTTIGGAPTGSGGTGTLTFSWMPVNGLNDPSAANPMASPTATTTYTVTVTDANNSKATDQMTVTVNPRPAVNAGADRSIFVGQSVALGARPTATGGTPPYIFNWTPTAGLNNPAAANPNARPVVTTKYFVNVTDAKGCSNLDSVTITVRDEVFLAQEYIHFHGPRASEGNMHANGSINFHIGRPSVIKGNLEAVEDILIRAKNTIDGNVTAGHHVSLIGNAKVTGAVNIAPVPAVPFPALTFTAGGKNITVGSKQSLTLPPGSYGEVKVLNGGKLTLASGQYYMSKFEMNSSAQLTVDVAAGPATINIVGNFKFGDKAKVVITPTEPMASAQVGFIALTSASIEIGERAVVRGAIIAPNAMVTLQEDCQFKGSISAEKIDVHSGARFFPHGSTSLLKSDELDDASESVDVQSPVTSYQLEQNYPNPFNPSTKIEFSVLEAGDVQLAIYNLQGQEIRTLISGPLEAGRHAIRWNGRDNTGKLAPSGVYLYKLRVNGFEETRKMTLMK